MSFSKDKGQINLPNLGSPTVLFKVMGEILGRIGKNFFIDEDGRKFNLLEFGVVSGTEGSRMMVP